MTLFSKIQFPFALKLYFNGGSFYKEISKFGYFKLWKNVRMKLKWLWKLSQELAKNWEQMN